MLKNFYLSLITIGSYIQPIFLLAIRLFWGWQFFSSGWEKLLNMGHVIEFFQTLNIPFPTINAYAVASIELIGGLCLMLGLASRLVSIPLMVVMFVAMATAHNEAFVNVFSDPQEFVKHGPFNFFLTSLIIFAFGPGALSLDGLLKRFFFKRTV